MPEPPTRCPKSPTYAVENLLAFITTERPLLSWDERKRFPCIEQEYQLKEKILWRFLQRLRRNVSWVAIDITKWVNISNSALFLSNSMRWLEFLGRSFKKIQKWFYKWDWWFEWNFLQFEIEFSLKCEFFSYANRVSCHSDESIERMRLSREKQRPPIGRKKRVVLVPAGCPLWHTTVLAFARALELPHTST